MSKCEKCSQTLVCPVHREDVGPAEIFASCREDCAVWVRVLGRQRTGVDDYAPIPGVEGVKVVLGKHERTTDTVGFAGFDPLDPGKHAPEISLSKALSERFHDPDPATKAEHVAADQVKQVIFELAPRAVLTVVVHPRGKPLKRFEGATVTVSGGPEKLTGRTKNGTAAFGPMRDREYTVAVELDAEDFVSPKATKTVQLGEVDREFAFEIEAVNVVTPTILPGVGVAVARMRAGLAVAPTKIVLALVQTNREAHAYAKGGTLVAVPPDVVEIFTDERCEAPLEGGKIPETVAGTEPVPLWLRGKAGTEPEKVTLTFTPDDPADTAMRLGSPKVELAVELVDVEVPAAVAAVLPPASKGGNAEVSILAKGTPAPGAYVWQPLAEASNDAAIADGRDTDTLRIEASTPGTAIAEVEYAPESAPAVKARARSKAIFFRIEPTVSVIAVDAEAGSALEPEVMGLPDTGVKLWKLGDNAFEAAVDGVLDLVKLKVTSKKAGLVALELGYTPEGSEEAVVAHGAVAFVGASITKITQETEAIDDVPATDREEYEVLVDLAEDGAKADPAAWKTGYVQLEAEGKPDKLVALALDEVPGTYEWTKPEADKLVVIAADQPDDEHDKAKAKVLLRAVPKPGPAGPDAVTGYDDEPVEITYDVEGTKVTDEITVRVHRHGCSGVKWERAGSGAVDDNDRLKVCDHEATPQWNGLLDWTPPPGGGAVERVAPRGHQHGGWCWACSGLEAEGDDDTVRDIWHWVPTSVTVLTHIRQLANLLVTYFNDVAADAGTYQLTNAAHTQGATLFTNAVWNGFNKRKKRPKRWRGVWGNDISHYKQQGRMLGVVRGFIGPTETWLHAISGFLDYGGDWCPLPGLGATPDASRDIASYHGGPETYVKANPPFDDVAMTGDWERLGICAAPRALARALARGMTQIELAEVWVNPPGGGFYIHNNEIGSCEQCRRFLGRMLCEVGPR